jgi:hypothetical protein
MYLENGIDKSLEVLRKSGGDTYDQKTLGFITFSTVSYDIFNQQFAKSSSQNHHVLDIL